MPVTEVTRMDAERRKWDDAFYAFLAEREWRLGPGPAGNLPGPADDIHWTGRASSLPGTGELV
jgi:hypothetical protein